MIIIKEVLNKNILIGRVRLLIRKYTSKAVPLIKKPLTDEQNKLFDIHKESILYSSFIESTKLKLGYQRNQIVSNLLKKQKENARLDAVRIKPLSLVAQLLSKDDTKPILTELCRQENSELQSKSLQNASKIIETLNDAQNELDSQDGSWMKDYETFDDNDEENTMGRFGTPDPSVPVSNVPCHGCGALLQCANSSLPGYLPSELFSGQSKKILKTITCQRCHFLKNYNTAINLTVSSDAYVKMISSIEDQFSLVVLLIDLTDFPCSIWPNITSIIGNKRPVFVVGNKVDLLPQDSKGHLNHIKKCLEQAIIEAGISETNIKHVGLMSAQTGYGVEELINKLHNIWRYKGDVYLLGCTNVGKSSLFNALLRSDFCKVKASNIIQKATASPWPGTTLRMLKFPILRPSDGRLYLRTHRLMSESTQKVAEAKLRRQQANETGHSKYATLIGHIGRTFEHQDHEVSDSFSVGTGFRQPILSLDESSKEYVTSKWCYDTPGVFQPQQILDLLTTEEIMLTISKTMLIPRTFLFKPGLTLFLAGLGRIDYIMGPESIRLTVYAASTLPILIVKSEAADQIYGELLGTEFLAVPHGDSERLAKWPALENLEMNIQGEGDDISACDILMSSSGWIAPSFSKNEEISIKVWTPQRKGIFMRKPALVPYGILLRGARIRSSLAYRSDIAFKKK